MLLSDPATRPGTAANSAAAITCVDTHAHVFARNMRMIEGRRYTPDYDATIADYLAMLDNHGFSHGVLVQVSFLGTDNSYLVEALRQEPARLRGIVVVEPTITTEELHALDQVGVVGVRLNLIGLPDPPLANVEWQEHLDRLAKLDWQVEVQAEAQRLPHLLPVLLGAGVRVVVDHFGRPDQALGIDDPGFQYLLTVGKTRQVWVKLSGAYRNGQAARGNHIASFATPALLDEFGAERLLWGSDWPHTCFEHPDATGVAREALDRWISSDADWQTVLVDSPHRLFRFDPGAQAALNKAIQDEPIIPAMPFLREAAPSCDFRAPTGRDALAWKQHSINK